MGFNCGIVGLPNVGKSTLFNALTAATVDASNYPFCTIEPNVGRVPVPDTRLHEIATIARSKSVTPTSLEFIDIAGLVKGASAGEGLGNQFLAQIRSVDAIAHVVRCFGGNEVSHSQGSIDPVADVQIVEAELMLADLDSLVRRRESLIRKERGGDKDAMSLMDAIAVAESALEQGNPVRSLSLTAPMEQLVVSLELLSSKPVMYICNVDEAAIADGNDYSRSFQIYAESQGASCVTTSARLEAEIGLIEELDERDKFLMALGLGESGLSRVIKAGYALLELITFFTAGPKEARAWTIRSGSRAVEAAGRIHSDFARGFIRAETISFEDYLSLGGESPCRDQGRLRQEGRDYLVEDGDIILFRFNV